MRGCDIGTEALGKILAVPRALRRFTFKDTIRYLTLRKENSRQHYIDTIAQQQGHSLLALDLDFPAEAARSVPADFLSLSVLQQLATTVDVLEGNLCVWVSPLTIHLFPKSLRHVHIIDDYKRRDPTRAYRLYAEAAHRWLVDDTLPNVRTVTFSTMERRFDPFDPMPEESDVSLPNTNVVLRRRHAQPHGPFPDIECFCCESSTMCGNSYGK